MAEPVAEEISLAIFSMNNLEIGSLAAREDAVVLSFPASVSETKEIILPRDQVKAASSARVGRIGLDSYVMRIFISTALAARLREEILKVRIENSFGAPLSPQTFSTVTGEHAEFFINAQDVFGQNARGPARARRFMDAVNGTSPERLKLPE